MNADGTNHTRLTNAPGDDFVPIRSPDGTKILFDTHRDGDGEVYVINADGSNQQRITFNPGFDGRCDWQRPCTITSSSDIIGTGIVRADGSYIDVPTNAPGANRATR